MAANTESPFSDTSWIASDKKGNTLISIHVQPAAKRTLPIGLYGNKLKIALASPPVDGKANATLVKFLSKSLGLSKSSVRIVSGETSREKRLELMDISPDAFVAALKKAFPDL